MMKSKIGNHLWAEVFVGQNIILWVNIYCFFSTDYDLLRSFQISCYWFGVFTLLNGLFGIGNYLSKVKSFLSESNDDYDEESYKTNFYVIFSIILSIFGLIIMMYCRNSF